MTKAGHPTKSEPQGKRNGKRREAPTAGQVLLVYKKSPYQLYVQERGDAAYKEALARDPAMERTLIAGHERQQEAFAAVEATLGRRGISFKSRWRGRKRSTRGYSLVIAVGGDGTLLDTAQYILDDTPLLGINSDPSQSVGKLCAATAAQLDEVLDALDGRLLRPAAHVRLRVRVDDQEVLGPCLNDVLFAHRSPADMSRFVFHVHREESAGKDDKTCDIRSSGIWIASPTGSTAAIRSAGGKVMPIRSKRLQYLVREPYSPPELQPASPKSGFITPGQCLRLESRMDKGFVWGDGPHRRAGVRYGQTVRIDAHPQPLWIYRREYPVSGKKPH